MQWSYKKKKLGTARLWGSVHSEYCYAKATSSVWYKTPLHNFPAYYVPTWHISNWTQNINLTYFITSKWPAVMKRDHSVGFLKILPSDNINLKKLRGQVVKCCINYNISNKSYRNLLTMSCLRVSLCVCMYICRVALILKG